MPLGEQPHKDAQPRRTCRSRSLAAVERQQPSTERGQQRQPQHSSQKVAPRRRQHGLQEDRKRWNSKILETRPQLPRPPNLSTKFFSLLADIQLERAAHMPRGPSAGCSACGAVLIPWRASHKATRPPPLKTKFLSSSSTTRRSVPAAAERTPKCRPATAHKISLAKAGRR